MRQEDISCANRNPFKCEFLRMQNNTAVTNMSPPELRNKTIFNKADYLVEEIKRVLHLKRVVPRTHDLRLDMLGSE